MGGEDGGLGEGGIVKRGGGKGEGYGRRGG